ncbi:MAG: hypothetical protein HUJ31_11860 [Pseudomonadales bacterium]|nr:hypothetical protein [Pseudomonadales bacterium]
MEAAVLLALQAPESFTDEVHHDAALIKLLADEATRERFRKENPKGWVSAMEAG